MAVKPSRPLVRSNDCEGDTVSVEGFVTGKILWEQLGWNRIGMEL